ncbi:E3 ubiquitin-protein ligase RHF1A [Coffea arabica]|uniref:RING-type E3 ubiquitin transferase n=1 Tax=Coffea arabica TaxID=13443 RepID=A0A6P6WLA2_COFAR
MATEMIISSDNPSTIMKTMTISTPSSSFPATDNAAGDVAVSDDCFEDGCSICLEPFSSHDPPTVTNCKHEYHLHCILEWSQRSTECPICCQLLELKDPTSQELLCAAKVERSKRARSSIRVVYEGPEVNHDSSYVNDPDEEEQFLQHFAAATSRARHVNRSRRQTASRLDSSEVFPTVPLENGINLTYGLEGGLATTGAPASTIEVEASSAVPSVVDVTSMTPETGDGHVGHRIFFRQPSPDAPRKLNSFEFLAFSESVKAKVSAASARYKETITKSTRGFKDKLLARNTTVKELGRGVQREMSAGIAGVARMIERLDLSSKRTGVFVPQSSAPVETPGAPAPAADTVNFSHEGKNVEKSIATQYPIAGYREITHGMSSDVLSFNSTTRPAQADVSLI